MSHNQLVESLYARAESAEARVKELEDKAAGYLHAFKDGCVRSEERITELECQRDLAQDEARALNEKRAELRATIRDLEARAESAEARVRELEAAADRNANVIYADESVERYRKRIADLESDLDFANDCLEASRRNGQTLSERITDLESQLAAAREEQG